MGERGKALGNVGSHPRFGAALSDQGGAGASALPGSRPRPILGCRLAASHPCYSYSGDTPGGRRSSPPPPSRLAMSREWLGGTPARPPTWPAPAHAGVYGMRRMRLVAFAALVFGAWLSLGSLEKGRIGVGAAEAAGGCGIGFHRGPYGGCRRNVYGGYYGGAAPFWGGGGGGRPR